MDSTYVRLISEKLNYRSIINLGLINKETNRIILKELQYYFNIIPDYIKRNREFKQYHNDIFIAIQDTYPESSLYDILVYLNTNGFKELKKRTDEYIEKNGLKEAIIEQEKNNTLTPISLFDVSNITSMVEIFNDTEYEGPLNLWDTSKVTDMSEMATL